MAAMASGDSGALQALYDRHASLLFALCLRILRDRADAEEVLGDTFHELWRRADRFDPDRGAALPYMIGVARSRAIDRL
ncbi:MAG TPA: sigma factor, partial [Candidatus Polarisedimenticolia bacterium]|nr:sigma factor [Candidatus Polarisedimenticolia bacterium]